MFLAATTGGWRGFTAVAVLAVIAGVGLGTLDTYGLPLLYFLVILDNYCKIRLFAGVFILNREEIEQF